MKWILEKERQAFQDGFLKEKEKRWQVLGTVGAGSGFRAEMGS